MSRVLWVWVARTLADASGTTKLFPILCRFRENCIGRSKREGARDVSPTLVHFLNFHAVFGKNWPKNRLASLPLGLEPLCWKFWICHNKIWYATFERKVSVETFYWFWRYKPFAHFGYETPNQIDLENINNSPIVKRILLVWALIFCSVSKLCCIYSNMLSMGFIVFHNSRLIRWILQNKICKGLNLYHLPRSQQP